MLKTDFSYFAADAIGYHPGNALILAEAARLAYGDADVIEKAVNDVWKITAFKYISQREGRRFIFSGRFDTQAFVVGNNDVIILAFRGTEPTNKNDWKTDFNFRKYTVKLTSLRQQAAQASTQKTLKTLSEQISSHSVVFKYKPRTVHVHKGFWLALELVWDEVFEQIQTLRSNNQPIWITGHSLGGALASLAAFRLSYLEGVEFGGLYTYGQPRVGGWDFANLFKISHEKKIARFVNNNDFVTFVPPFLFRFAHVGQLYYLTANGKLVKNGLPFAKAVFDRIIGFRDFGQLDHSLDAYITIIQDGLYS